MTVPVQPDAWVCQAARIATRTIDGQAVVVVNDRNAMHILDAVGSFIWEAADAPVQVDTLVGRVEAEFAVPDQTPDVRADVLAFVQELLDVGALELRTPE